VSGEVEFLITAVPVFLSIFIPGFLLALALLKKTKMHLAEIAVFGFILGLIFPPLLLFAYSFFGILYTPQLAIINIILVTVIGFLLCMNEGALSIELSFDYRRDAVWVLLLFIMLFAFWVRVQSIGPIFYEFDPYYYDQVTQFILTQGHAPKTDDLAWYPNLDWHRHPPIVSYLEAQWYAIHGYVTNNQQFNNYLLSTVAGVYPPVVGALICFLVFIVISEEYGMKYGLIGAVLVAIIPRTIEKFAAGESELQPWGVFAAFLFYATYAIAVSRKDKRFAVLAGIAVMAATLGSTADVLVYLVVAGYIVVQSLLNYLKNESSWDLIKVNAVIFCFAVFSWVLFLLYTMNSNSEGTPQFELPSDVLGFASALGFAFGLELISQRIKNREEKINYLAGYMALGVVLLFITFIPSFPVQLGPRIWNYVTSAAAIARPPNALMMTVAEETPTSGDFASSIGFLGSSSDVVFGILLLSFAAILYSIYRGSEFGLLFGMMIFPVSYVGLSKSKYMLHVSFMIGIAVTILFGELDKVLRNTLKKEFGDDAAKWGVFGVALLALSAECFVYPGASSLGGPAVDIIGGTLDSKYQLKDTTYLLEMGRNCTLLAEDGKPISYYLFCSRIPKYWRDPMDWIKENVGEDEGVISWWDYGHWINYWGEKKCVTRNDHKYPDMDLEVADKFVANTPEALKEYMEAHKAKYVLFDQDLIGKWGALNFLSCVYNNETNMSFAFKEGQRLGGMYQLGTSQCEREHNFERILIPVEPTIRDYCQTSNQTIPLVRAYSTFQQYTYCVRLQETEGGRSILGVFYGDNTSRLNRGIPIYAGQQSDGTRTYDVYTMFYTNEVWPDGGNGWGDRKGKMYDSTFYRGFILGELPGFEQTYPAGNKSGPVRIFKIVE
jgi:asparagine N-glycosylation enzyme membrane subunit Stt3